MTHEEAIKQLESLIDNRKHLIACWEDVPTEQEPGIQALTIARETTKKQIPTRVIRVHTPKGNIEQCPACHTTFEWANDYCKHCGQALDWNKEELE